MKNGDYYTNKWISVVLKKDQQVYDNVDIELEKYETSKD